MSVIADILRSWSDPRGLILAKTAERREDRAVATLMGASALIFVAQWPEMARKASLDPSIPMDARVGASLMAVVFLFPLVMYVLAGVIHLVARALGGQGSGFDVRMSLFQPLLSCAPLFLLNGLVRGMVGPGAAATAAGLIAFVGFLWMWVSMLMAVERRREDV